jgi:HSP20 family protein
MARDFFDPWRMSDPWGALSRLRNELDRPVAGRPVQRHGTPFPPVNLYETPDGYVVTAEIPGLRREDIELSVDGDRVVLRGERAIAYERDERTSLHRRERQAGSFRRAFQLPVSVDPEKAEAVYESGVLVLRLPKAEAHQPRRIAVQSN